MYCDFGMGKMTSKKQLPSVPMALLCPVIVVFKIIAAVCQLLNNEGHSVTRVGKSEMISNISCFCKQKLAPAGRDVLKVKKPRNYKKAFSTVQFALMKYPKTWQQNSIEEFCIQKKTLIKLIIEIQNDSNDG